NCAVGREETDRALAVGARRSTPRGVGVTPSSSTMVEAVPEGMVRGASEAVDALRAALRAGDVEAVQQRRWLAPRPPGERDLLSDMAAAEGIQTAVRRLSKFWQRTAVRREGVR